MCYLKDLYKFDQNYKEINYLENDIKKLYLCFYMQLHTTLHIFLCFIPCSLDLQKNVTLIKYL